MIKSSDKSDMFQASESRNRSGIDVNGVGSNPQTRLLSLLDRRRKELLS